MCRLTHEQGALCGPGCAVWLREKGEILLSASDNAGGGVNDM